MEGGGVGLGNMGAVCYFVSCEDWKGSCGQSHFEVGASGAIELLYLSYFAQALWLEDI